MRTFSANGFFSAGCSMHCPESRTSSRGNGNGCNLPPPNRRKVARPGARSETDQVRRAGFAAVKSKVLAQDPYRFGPARLEIFGHIDRMPEHPHVSARFRSRSGLVKVVMQSAFLLARHLFLVMGYLLAAVALAIKSRIGFGSMNSGSSEEKYLTPFTRRTSGAMSSLGMSILSESAKRFSWT